MDPLQVVIDGKTYRVGDEFYIDYNGTKHLARIHCINHNGQYVKVCWIKKIGYYTKYEFGEVSSYFTPKDSVGREVLQPVTVDEYFDDIRSIAESCPSIPCSKSVDEAMEDIHFLIDDGIEWSFAVKNDDMDFDLYYLFKY